MPLYRLPAVSGFCQPCLPLAAIARLRDVRSGERGAYARPCGLELPRAVIQSGAGPAVTSERWLTVKVAVPPPTRCMGRDAVAFHDPAKIT